MLEEGHEEEPRQIISVSRTSNRSTPGHNTVLTPKTGITRLGGSKSYEEERQ
jgi:hypothetical protein